MADDVKLKVGADVSSAERNIRQFAGNVEGHLSKIEKGFGALRGTATVAMAAFAVDKLAEFFGKGIEAALEQEKAMGRLAQQMKLTGDFSDTALEKFGEFADAMERTTGVGDDLVLNQLAVAKSFGTTNREAQALVRAALDLSAATGQSLDSAVQNLGKTLAGVTGKLDEQIPALKDLTKEQLAAGDAIKIVQERFGGSAEAKMDGFAGAVTRLSNAWGNLNEGFGTTITKSSIIEGALNGIAQGIENLSDAYGKDDEKLARAKAGVSAGQQFAADYEMRQRDPIGYEKELARRSRQAAVDAGPPRAVYEQQLEDWKVIEERKAQITKGESEKRAKAEAAAQEKALRDQAARAKATGPFITPEQRADIGRAKAFVGPPISNEERQWIEAQNKERDRLDAEAKAKRQANIDTASSLVGTAFSAGDGASGARALAQSAGAMMADAFVPGLGQAVGPILGKLMEGKEATKEFVRGLVEAMPDVVEAIGESAPVLVEALVDSMINEGGAERLGIAIMKAMTEAPAKALGKAVGLEFGNNFNRSQIVPTIKSAFGQGAERMHNWRAGFDRSITSFQNAGHQVGVNLSNGWKDMPGDLKTGFTDGKAAFLTGLDEAFGKSVDAIQGKVDEAIKNLAIPRPAWLDEVIEEIRKLLGGPKKPKTGSKEGDQAVDTAVRVQEAVLTYGASEFSLTGGGSSGSGDLSSGDAILLILGRILDQLKKTTTVSTSVKWNNKEIAKMLLDLDRRGARTAA